MRDVLRGLPFALYMTSSIAIFLGVEWWLLDHFSLKLLIPLFIIALILWAAKGYGKDLRLREREEHPNAEQ